MKIYWKEAGILFGVITIAIVGLSGRTAPPWSAREAIPNLSQEETALQESTKRIAVETLGLKLEGKPESGHSANFSGLRTENLTFTQRLDSRTFIAYDRRFSQTKEKGVYRESDEALLKKSRSVLESLKIPMNEVESEKILQEKTQVGQRVGKTRKIRKEAVELGKKYALVTRHVAGVPVFSSRAMIALIPGGEIGFLEVHWPEIPAQTVEEAGRYRELVEKKWQAPKLHGARVESVTAGIIHSPAAATAMDIYPVIRVIYAPEDKRQGKKPVGYFDANGKPVPVPRTFLEPPHEDLKQKRTAPKKTTPKK
jgi:hypothetical protein